MPGHFLTVSKDRQRLVLVVPDLPSMRAAAAAVHGAKQGAVLEGQCSYSYPAVPAVAQELSEAFIPTVSKEATLLFMGLLGQAAELRWAVEEKDKEQVLPPGCGLLTEAMAHQRQAIAFCARRFKSGAGGSALLMEQGTGKSLVAIALANWLRELGRIKWVLVVAPNSVKGQWVDEVAKHSSVPTAVNVLRGSRAKRLEQAQAILGADGLPDVQWLATNWEQFAVDIRGRGAPTENFHAFRELCATRPGLLILDESSAIKNPEAKRTQAVLQLRDAFSHRLILNGTPVEVGPLDVYSQFEALEPGMLGFRSALAFERAYAKYRSIQVTNRRGARVSVKVVADYQNLDDLEKRLAPLSFRARAEDCLDLPPVVVTHVPVELSYTQSRLLRELKQGVGTFADGDAVDGRNILARYQRMAQLVGGWVKATKPDGLTTEWRALKENPKLAALEDYLATALEDPTRKVVVFAEHPETELAAIATMADRRKWGSVLVHGGVKEEDRNVGRQAFDMAFGPRVFCAQWETAARGLNLTRADTLVFYGLTWRYGTWAQARKRIHRIGQVADHVREVYLVGEATKARGTGRVRTMDHVMLEAMRGKQNVADIVTGDAARDIIGV